MIFDFAKLAIVTIAAAAAMVACAPAGKTNFESQKVFSIYQGTEVRRRDSDAARSVVLIKLEDFSHNSAGRCTGTLVGPNTVLTAAHCFDTKLLSNFVNFRIVFNETAFTGANEVSRAGVKFKIHPLYKSAGPQKIYQHDLALATFEGSLPSSARIAPIETDAKIDYGNADLEVYGYGFYKNPRGFPLDISNEVSGVLHRGILRADSDYLQFGGQYWVSARSPSHLCHGDSGGPQFSTRDSVQKIVGINSTAMGGKVLPDGKADCTGSSNATRVAFYAGWILSEQAKLQR